MYEALIEAMKSRSSLISLSDFESRYKELMSPNGDSGKNGLTLQFEVVRDFTLILFFEDAIIS